jgi:hypothetical protein
MTKSTGIAVLILAAVAGYLAYSGAFYPTGRQYYEVCLEKHNSGDHASDAYRDIVWASCESVAARVIFASGIMAAREPENDDDKDAIALQAVCPFAPRLG